jgi:hypothetical protein
VVADVLVSEIVVDRSHPAHNLDGVPIRLFLAGDHDFLAGPWLRRVFVEERRPLRE